MTIHTIYGIKNCATMKKAFDYLNSQNIVYEFFDYKKQTLSQETFIQFVNAFGLWRVINKQGTTYKKLDDDTKAVLASEDLERVYAIIKDNQSMIKRPIVMTEGQSVSLIGFDEKQWHEAFGT